jgi:hypothetical protein
MGRTSGLMTAAVVAFTMLLAAPSPSGAAEQRADGVYSRNDQLTEMSTQRRWYRHRYGVRRYWRPRYRYAYPYYWGPPYAYAWVGGPYYPYYYRYYYRPRPFIAFGFGPFGFGVW